ncbi:MAG: hypothetical protein KDD89_16090, partial [Anaerolineales bacterium]|nr:hypothetical protein [Anaerolineales bacterium]
PGNFGRWDPITYRYLSPPEDERTDQTTAEWVMTFTRHVGGGPAQTSQDGLPLTSLAPNADHPETSIIDPETGEARPWNWAESGIVEMNCFLCHIAEPNNEARIAELAEGNFGWANTATLVGTGIVTQTAPNAALSWVPEAFDDSGRLLRSIVPIQDPTNQNCAQCHGEIHENIDDPLLVVGGDQSAWRTLTTGQIVSPQRISDSALNVSNKADLSRSFDIHAERVLACTDCHYALNNPIYTQESDVTRPEHLIFDPRRLDFDAFLYRPLHQFAKGSSAQSNLAPEFDNTIRRCESCHTAVEGESHAWLPYAERHMQTMACETCHIPEVYGPAQQTVDWTAVRLDGSPLAEYRGIE